MPTYVLSPAAPTEVEADVLVLGVFSGGELAPGGAAIAAALGVDAAAVIEQSPLMADRFTGALGEVIAVPTPGQSCKQVLLVGVGPRKGLDSHRLRKVSASAASKVGGARTVAFAVSLSVKPSEENFSAIVEGFELATYSFDRFRAKTKRPNQVAEVTLLVKNKIDKRTTRKIVDRTLVLTEATKLCRDLINTPSSDKSPASLADEAARIAAANDLEIEVFEEERLEQEGFGGLIGVGRGSVNPPRLVEMIYKAPRAKKVIALVGKGITFDSGGLSLKPSGSMVTMKTDMSGAAVVLSAMQAIAALRPSGVEVRGYIACAENMPDGNAQRPGDVITHYGGKTSEVANTDAEGRLVLADAIALAVEREADVIVDVATLTGAVLAALGRDIFAVMGTDAKEVKSVLKAAQAVGEPAWELPLYEDYKSAISSEIADVNNMGSPDVGAGTITAGLFLAAFSGDTPHVHLDIAGAARASSDRFEMTAGATGVGVRTLVQYVLSQA